MEYKTFTSIGQKKCLTLQFHLFSLLYTLLQVFFFFSPLLLSLKFTPKTYVIMIVCQTAITLSWDLQDLLHTLFKKPPFGIVVIFAGSYSLIL